MITLQCTYNLCLAPGGVLNFHFGRGVLPEESKMGACRMDRHQIWGLAELIFLTTTLLAELILCPNEAS